MNFDSVLKLLIENFEKHQIRFALMGGFALHVAGFTRATQDIDFLIDREDLPKVKGLMFSFGYELLHESEDTTNFLGKLKELGKVDFLHAHRSYAKAMLQRARDHEVFDGKFKIKVIVPEDLIGLKVQASSNDPERYHQDMADIEYVLKANKGRLNLDLVREYFELFHREKELEGILEKINYAD